MSTLAFRGSALCNLHTHISFDAITSWPVSWVNFYYADVKHPKASASERTTHALCTHSREWENAFIRLLMPAIRAVDGERMRAGRSVRASARSISSSLARWWASAEIVCSGIHLENSRYYSTVHYLLPAVYKGMQALLFAVDFRRVYSVPSNNPCNFLLFTKVMAPWHSQPMDLRWLLVLCWASTAISKLDWCGTELHVQR